MKRDNYQIILNGRNVSIKHRWNAARKQIISIVKSHLKVGQKARQESFDFEKVDDKFIYGKSLWLTDDNETMLFEIRKF